MCKRPKMPAPPPVVQRDPVAEQRAAENQAQRYANAEIAARRKKLKANSLFTVGPKGVTGSPTHSAYAQAVAKSTTMGGT